MNATPIWLIVGLGIAALLFLGGIAAVVIFATRRRG
jgi:hypothetical protein